MMLNILDVAHTSDIIDDIPIISTDMSITDNDLAIMCTVISTRLGVIFADVLLYHLLLMDASPTYWKLARTSDISDNNIPNISTDMSDIIDNDTAIMCTDISTSKSYFCFQFPCVRCLSKCYELHIWYATIIGSNSMQSLHMCTCKWWQFYLKHICNVHHKLEDGYNIVRNSDGYWVGLFTDLIIEHWAGTDKRWKEA